MFWLTAALVNIAALAILVILQRWQELQNRINNLRSSLSSAEAHLALASVDRDSLKKMEELAFHDSLTGIHNRLAFIDRAHQALSLANRNKEQVALLLIDLDGFKQINDDHGHIIGDKVLKVVAERFRSVLREADTVARYGGDEFAVLLSGESSRDGVNKAIEKIQEAIAGPINLEDKVLSLGASVGSALHPNDSRALEGLIAHADSDMYRHKKQRKQMSLRYTA